MSPENAFLCGYSSTRVGKTPDCTTDDLAVEASLTALADCGFDLCDLDGILTCVPMVGAGARPSMVLAEQLGVSASLSHFDSVALSGASPLAAVCDAFALIAAGTCDVVLVVAADTPRTGQVRSEAVASFARMRHPVWEQPLGLTNAAAYGLLASAYCARHSLEPGALAPLPVQMREHARATSTAAYREPLTIEDVRASREIASPLRLYDCPPVSDGAGALVVARESRIPAGSMRVRLAGAARATTHDSISYARLGRPTGCAQAAENALATAGMQLADLDMAFLYDSYSIALAIELEELGLCPPGKAAAFVAEGGIDIAGSLPVNPHGGLLSHAHCGGAAGVHHVVEAMRQLHGKADNQVPSPSVAFVHNEGGILSGHAAAVFELAS